MEPWSSGRGSLYFSGMKFHLFSKIFLCLCLAGVFSQAQETVESVRRQIKSVEAETAREKSLHDAEKKRHSEFVEVGRKKVQALASQNKTLKAEIDSLKAELKNLADARQKAMGTVKYFENRKAKYGESLAKVIDSLVPVFESDFPYRNDETIKSVQEIARRSQPYARGFLRPNPPWLHDRSLQGIPAGGCPQRSRNIPALWCSVFCIREQRRQRRALACSDRRWRLQLEECI